MNLYPRTTGGSARAEVQHDVMARRILDRARKGEEVREDLIDWALNRTGDAKPLTAAEAAHCIQPDSEAYAAMDDMGRYAEAKREGEAA
jgi:hypothetical protein